jgi:hypothetical protein
VEDQPTGEGFRVFSAGTDLTEDKLGRLNPQTQESVLRVDGDGDDDDHGSRGSRKRGSASALARTTLARTYNP